MKTHSKLNPAEDKSSATYRRAINKNPESLEAETSDYDSDGGTNYKPYTTLSNGVYDFARIFRAESGKKVVVLKPVEAKQIDMLQAINKHRFFKTLYPTKQSHLFKYKKPKRDVRNVVPFFPGYTLDKCSHINNLKKFITCALGAVEAVEKCHAEKLVIIDINPGNFIYTPSSYKPEVHLIDGGESRKVGERVDNKFCLKESEVEAFFMQCSQIAPEIISTTSKCKRAEIPMDYYAFTNALNALLEPIDTNLSFYPILIHPFQTKNPKNRPSLSAWKEKLMACEYIFITAIQQIHEISTDFSSCINLLEVRSSRQKAHLKMSDLLCSEIFLGKCAVLGVERDVPVEVYNACVEKTKEINDAADKRSSELNENRARLRF